MDVTPSDKMFEAMKKFTDAVCGDAPSRLEISPGALARRMKRRLTMDFLHQFAAQCMREGLNRGIIEARQRKQGMQPVDKQDRNAVDKAKDDAARGEAMVIIP
jgi:hypothetical protein